MMMRNILNQFMTEIQHPEVKPRIDGFVQTVVHVLLSILKPYIYFFFIMFTIMNIMLIIILYNTWIR